VTATACAPGVGRAATVSSAREKCRPYPPHGQAPVSREFVRHPNRTHAPSPRQNIRLSSDMANPLSRSRNWRADGDGCVGLHHQVSRRRAPGTVGDGHSASTAERDRTLKPLHLALRRASDRYSVCVGVSLDRATVSPDCSVGLRTPTPHLDSPPRARIKWCQVVEAAEEQQPIPSTSG
jgi:hypothetical protein